MGKTVKNMFGGGGKARVKAETDSAKAASERESARLAEQSRILNERNKELQGEGSTARQGRRGRRMLAYKGQETGLRQTLGG